MSLRINQNIDAMNSYRNLSVTQGQMSKSLEKLSSGFRINRAADDAAGLAISEGLRSQVGGLKVASRNAQDGVSVVQTAEGALTETHSILQRMRDLAVQASNDGGLNTDAKKNIQDEMSQLKTEITRIADTTEFNGTKLLDGSFNGSFQVGANNTAQDRISVDLVRTNGLSASGLGLSGLDVTAVAANATTGTNTTDAESGTAGVMTLGAATDYSDDATAVAEFSKLNGTVTIGNKSLDLSSVKYDTATDAATAQAALQSALDSTFGAGAATADASGGAGIEITTASVTGTAAEVAAAEASFKPASGAQEAISLLDTAIKDVSSVRSQLGAAQNRFEHTINNLNVAVENLSASESRIRDTDMAQEMMSFTRSQILSQAGTAMLAQANSASQGVLSLLRG
ncbi:MULTISPECIES: flagellin N-terminal helical domain-containing protein [unclassified Nocardioides]|uniref:flagellin N-terminal helical domain-containing protein n=1 Tax=unclassified Nocardioides TaxID=2615069 RepID=UPI0007029C0B|nr:MULTISPECIES: flagellin [unclassified Nocardioides]KQP63290.1 flagellin [Nocardioides sp. Leaf285]KQQ39766.1 flagellin [Nocardioides sp. Leaf307]